ncbi:hypothetical protein NSQ90_14570 [Paenibacillus sp. FSL H7-0737]|uniref:hypothetical protein n=1 Tax=Paenibacillus sp. FSL H7-0737 TaxID=1536775 RepID=UPI0012E01E32|nr:hypothetical protein [Paenibacillus sp. FSL H7-0737]
MSTNYFFAAKWIYNVKGPRKLTLTVTKSQISNNATVANQNFSHDTTNNPLSCNTTMIQFAGRPFVWYYLNVVTGATVIRGTVSPPVDINAIGYNPLDNYLCVSIYSV